MTHCSGQNSNWPNQVTWGPSNRCDTARAKLHSISLLVTFLLESKRTLQSRWHSTEEEYRRATLDDTWFDCLILGRCNLAQLPMRWNQIVWTKLFDLPSPQWSSILCGFVQNADYFWALLLRSCIGKSIYRRASMYLRRRWENTSRQHSGNRQNSVAICMSASWLSRIPDSRWGNASTAQHSCYKLMCLFWKTLRTITDWH